MGNEIITNNLSFSYGKEKILKELNLVFNQNKFISIIGPNGSGKTTLLKLLLRLLKADKGEITLNGNNIKKYANKELAREIAYVPQKSEIDFEFTVYEIVSMGRAPYIKNLNRENQNDKLIIENAMKMTNTWKFREKYINCLSGGELQMVMIARAITQDTKIIILDEPISHLDIHHQVEIMNTLKKINKEKEALIITVLHDINLASQYSDEILLLKKGEIIAKGEPQKVINKENIKKVYNMEFLFLEHPNNKLPYILPV